MFEANHPEFSRHLPDENEKRFTPSSNTNHAFFVCVPFFNPRREVWLGIFWLFMEG